ncbi:hypothetical protein ID866_10060 [Astraeus odoratus]|nr:hypothetical protein ID866_10060 [Astraeus odoratus]
MLDHVVVTFIYVERLNRKMNGNPGPGQPGR